MIFLSSTVRGFWLSKWMQDSPPAHRQSVAGEVMSLMTTGAIAPPVEAEYELKDFAAAVKHAETPGRSGKVLLVG
jgi:mitochondrial enoyl-[acyl-carrier protein] reductase / trans-2-enoyl-CoA reductase